MVRTSEASEQPWNGRAKKHVYQIKFHSAHSHAKRGSSAIGWIVRSVSFFFSIFDIAAADVVAVAGALTPAKHK